MTNEREEDLSNNMEQAEMKEQEQDAVEAEEGKETEQLKQEISELNNRYLRLYADFENYKRLTAKDKEDLIKYSNEGLMRELLSVIDHLELALQHASNSENASALAKGVEMTMRELKTLLEKYNLVSIESLGKPFDPSVHHAISQIESEDDEENIVVTEFRKGYKLRDRVLRAALVGVSKKPSQKEEDSEETEKPEPETNKLEIEEE
jgi:molecular chaperone GrpE